MPDVHADPDKLRQLAKTCKTSAAKIDEMARQLQRGLDAAEWRDSEGAKFAAEFKQTLKALQSIATGIQDKYPPTLQKKAAALDQYRR